MPRPAGSMLAESLQQLCRQSGVEFAYCQRSKKTQVVMSFRDARGAYWTVTGDELTGPGVEAPPYLTPDELNDRLYDNVAAKLAEWVSQRSNPSPRGDP